MRHSTGMRKRIGLIIGETANEYCMTLIDSIYKEVLELDYDIFVFVNYGIYDHNIVLYGEGESSVYKIPVPDSFDGFIIDETLFNIDKMGETVYDYFTKNVKCPIVYLKKRTERFYDMLLADRQAIKDITNHFIKDHGFTNICHMTGRWELQDARDRFRGYEEAMSEAGLDVTDDMIFYGDYWYNKGAEAVDFFTHGGNDLPQAIVCANDYMALAICKELTKRGIRVPEDVCVSGYDNEESGQHSDIPITTFDGNIPEFGRLAVLTLHAAINGECPPKETFVPSKMILRNSCGCRMCTVKDKVHFDVQRLNQKYQGLDMVVYMYNGFQMSLDIEDIFSNADAYFKHNEASYSYICLCEDALNATKRSVEQTNEYTDKMILKRIFFRDENNCYESPDLSFSRRDLLPVQFFDTEKPHVYYVHPIHSQNKCYGYMMSVYPENSGPNNYTQAYLSALGNALDEYNVHNEYMNMEEIKSMYLTDSLTGICNRRGFEQNMNMILDRSNRREIYLSVASIDMDGLKYINDTFGHEAGDNCLKAMGRALASVITSDEVAARYGGDEFAVILASKNPDRHLTFEADLIKAIEKENAGMDAPYTLHASIGLVHVGTGSYPTLAPYIQRADKLMYDNKARYKESLKQRN